MAHTEIGFVGRGWRFACLGLALLIGLGGLFTARAADRLIWRERENSVDAEIEGWPITRLLERVSAKTRWQIFLEPKTEHVVSAKFKGLKPGEALNRLLGNLNFVLVPVSNAPFKLYVFRTTAQAATDLITAPAENGQGGEGAKAIPNELIVTLKPGAKESIEDLAKRLGAKILGRADDLRAYRLAFEDDAATQAARTALVEDADVSAVDQNYQVARPDRPEALAMSALPPFNLRPKAIPDSSRVVVGLIDTAVQTRGTVLKDFLLPEVSVAGKATVPTDQLTHGTSMAETMLYRLSLSPDSAQGTPVRILSVDVYGNSESTTTFEIAKGISAAINPGGAAIINLSLGGEGDSRFLGDLIKAAHEQGIVFVGAAGNEPVTTRTYPAAYPEVIAVTASTRGGQIASWANRGDFVDVVAPGSSIVPFENQPYMVVGTSTATANVSAAAAAFMASGGKRGGELEALIRQAFAMKSKPPGGP